jgi:hypothetical protein
LTSLPSWKTVRKGRWKEGRTIGRKEDRKGRWKIGRKEDRKEGR